MCQIVLRSVWLFVEMKGRVWGPRTLNWGPWSVFSYKTRTGRHSSPTLGIGPSYRNLSSILHFDLLCLGEDVSKYASNVWDAIVLREVDSTHNTGAKSQQRASKCHDDVIRISLKYRLTIKFEEITRIESAWEKLDWSAAKNFQRATRETHTSGAQCVRTNQPLIWI
jgi:hypothetical protein